MIKIHERLYIGDLTVCRNGSAELVVIHACKSPCHQRSVGYTGNLPSDHASYLFLAEPYDLYLNIIDPPLPLFKMDSFGQFLAFASRHYKAGASLLIHCNQGESRAPTLALIFLSKYLRTIPDESFATAREAFTSLCVGYRPGLGIQKFLETNWHLIGTEA
jgi:hypothetical protein